MEKFKELMAQVLEVPTTDIQMESKLEDFPTWDSIAAVSFLAMVDSEYGAKLNAADVRKAETVSQLYNLMQMK